MINTEEHETDSYVKAFSPEATALGVTNKHVHINTRALCIKYACGLEASTRQSESSTERFG